MTKALNGFTKNETAIAFMEYLKNNTVEEKGFLEIYQQVINSFPNCDIFSDKKRIKFGYKDVNSVKKTRVGLMITKRGSSTYRLRIGCYKKEPTSTLAAELPREIVNLKISLTDIAKNPKTLTNLLNTAKKSNTFISVMNKGGKHKPDDYTLSNTKVTNNKPVATDQSEQSRASELATDLKNTTTIREVEARLGQGQFKKDVKILGGNHCLFSNCDVDALLIASHIKPWRDSAGPERHDANNGFILRADIDKLFDRHLITVIYNEKKNDLKIKASPAVRNEFKRLRSEVSFQKSVSLKNKNYNKKLLIAYLNTHNKLFAEKLEEQKINRYRKLKNAHPKIRAQQLSFTCSRLCNHCFTNGNKEGRQERAWMPK